VGLKGWSTELQEAAEGMGWGTLKKTRLSAELLSLQLPERRWWSASSGR